MRTVINPGSNARQRLPDNDPQFRPVLPLEVVDATSMAFSSGELMYNGKHFYLPSCTQITINDPVLSKNYFPMVPPLLMDTKIQPSRNLSISSGNAGTQRSFEPFLKELDPQVSGETGVC